MTKSRILVITLTAIIILSFVTGCSNSANANNGTEQANNNELSIGEIIERNLDIITGPSPDSNPYNYVNAHKAEYDEIVALGDDALQYIFSIFDEGGQYGLRGWIMAIACREILGEGTANPTFYTGQDWYNAYILVKYLHDINKDNTEAYFYLADDSGPQLLSDHDVQALTDILSKINVYHITENENREENNVEYGLYLIVDGKAWGIVQSDSIYGQSGTVFQDRAWWIQSEELGVFMLSFTDGQQ